MEKIITMPLEKGLSGFEIVVDLDRITLGFFEDLESPAMRDNLNALCGVIVGGKLPAGDIDADNIRLRLRALKPEQFMALAEGMLKAVRTPKNA